MENRQLLEMLIVYMDGVLKNSLKGEYSHIMVDPNDAKMLIKAIMERDK